MCDQFHFAFRLHCRIVYCGLVVLCFLHYSMLCRIFPHNRWKVAPFLFCANLLSQRVCLCYYKFCLYLRVYIDDCVSELLLTTFACCIIMNIDEKDLWCQNFIFYSSVSYARRRLLCFHQWRIKAVSGSPLGATKKIFWPRNSQAIDIRIVL